MEHEIIRADGLVSGDVLVLTKPLGSQSLGSKMNLGRPPNHRSLQIPACLSTPQVSRSRPCFFQHFSTSQIRDFADVRIAANLALWLGDEAKWRKASAMIDLDTALRAVQTLGSAPTGVEGDWRAGRRGSEFYSLCFCWLAGWCLFQLSGLFLGLNHQVT